MPCTEARRLANQRNAQKSTGPKTEAGKEASRRNALDHGMRSEAGLAPRHLHDAIARHADALSDAYRPETGPQAWLIGQAADAAARLDECQFLMRAQIDDQADRADLCWDEDHARAAEDLAARLPKQPARIARRLRQTVHGCLWLLSRWDALGHAIKEHGAWTEAQVELAFQLLGVAPELRAMHSYLTPEGDPDELADLVREQIDGLQSLLDDALAPLDAKERHLTQLGFPLNPSAETLRLRRYEIMLQKSFHQSLDAFHQLRSTGLAASEPMTTLNPEPAPGVEPKPRAPKPVPPVASPLTALARALEIAPGASPTVIPTPPAPSPSLPNQAASPALNRKARRAREKALRKAKARA